MLTQHLELVNADGSALNTHGTRSMTMMLQQERNNVVVVSPPPQREYSGWSSINL
jgi:hypothetical protein